MTRENQARRIATAAAYGGGGLVGVGAAVGGLLVAEGFLARKTIGIRRESAPYADGYYGPKRRGTSLRFVMMGDSSAAGLGANGPLETPGALIAQGLVDAADRPVRYVSVATVGARSEHLPGQIQRALILRPHVAVVMIGGNDVTHLVRPQKAVRFLEEGIRELVEAGTAVVVGTCPDIGTIRPVRQPLRWLARRLSRQLAAAQTIAVIDAGGRSVSLGSILGPEFDANPQDMFAADRFHPSSAGYAKAAEALLPSVLDSIGLAPAAEEELDPQRGDEFLPVAEGAVSAAEAEGVEVIGAVGGDTAHRGRWVQLRHRVRHPLRKPEPPAPLSADIPWADDPEPGPPRNLPMLRDPFAKR